MVIEKPKQLTMVKAVPLSFTGAFCATNVENSGESAITTIPQKIRKAINRYELEIRKARGTSKQHKQDNKRKRNAIFFTPNFSDKNPPNTQEMLPIPIIRKDIKGILKSI
jgi:hypothetical protein